MSFVDKIRGVYSKKWCLKYALLAVFFAYLVQNDRYEMDYVEIKSSRLYTGALAPEKIVKELEYVSVEKVKGPESLAIYKNAIYTSSGWECIFYKIVDKKIVKSIPILKNKQCSSQCCMPLGIRHWKDEKFIVADGRLGILEVDFESESVSTKLASTALIPGGKWSNMFADDLDFIDENTIIFSDFTANHAHEAFKSFFLLQKDSRLIKYNLVTGETEVLLEGTLGLNGVQKHSDGESVLVNESMGSRIYRYYFTGTKKGTTEIFVDKLPGLPDNIRASEDGKTFWCALYQTRNGGTSTFYQSLGAHPSVRKVLSVLFNYLPDAFGMILSSFGGSSNVILLELDGEGNIVNSIHELDEKLSLNTQITEHNGYLYIGTLTEGRMVRVKKQ